jgi:serine/threonine protein kinase
MTDRAFAAHAGPEDMEVLLDQFEAAWRAGAAPNLADYLPSAGPFRARLVEELVKIDLEYRWRGLPESSNGIGSDGAWSDAPRLENYQARADELGLALPFSLDLIGEEYWVRHRWGDRPDAAEYQQRFPDRADALTPLLARIHAELASEFQGDRPALAANLSEVTPAESDDTARPILTATAIIDFLAGSALLHESQRDELLHSLSPRFPELRLLAKELLARQWLTVFQMNRILQGKGKELQLGPHVLLDRLGEGATGWVYKARHVVLRRLVAVKVLREHLLADSEALSRFYREIQVISQLGHPHVIHAYDAGPSDGKHMLVMEYVEGMDLLSLVRQQGPLPWDQAQEYVAQAARGLQHIHEHGLVHRDIKPSNLLVCQAQGSQSLGLIKILDLGLARLGRIGRRPPDGRPGGGLSGRLTPRQAMGVGTPDFMAPEQALDFHAADARADIYSLGCTFFFLLTGQAPFPGGTMAAKLLRHQEESPPWNMLPATVPETGRQLLRQMLMKEAKDRPPTGADVCRALGAETGLTSPTDETKSVAVAVLASPSPSVDADMTVSEFAESTAIDSPRPPRSVKNRVVLRVLLVALLVLGLAVAALAILPNDHRPAAASRKKPSHAAPTAPAPLLNFEAGFGNGEGLKRNGSARVEGGRLILTDKSDQAGSAFSIERLPIQGFSSEFLVEIRGKPGEMADGFTFTIQDSGPDALGSSGGGLGYGPDPSNPSTDTRIGRSVAVKFDLYDNQGEGTNSTGLYENGATPGIKGSINLHGSGIDLHSQHIFRVRVQYSAGQLSVTITDTVTGASHSHTYLANLPTIIGSPKAHVGFTAGTGGLHARHAILRWKFSALAPPATVANSRAGS